MTDSLHERGQALEDMFFKQRDQKLLEDLRAKMNDTDGRESLMAASGIEDETVIDQLIAAGLKAETITAVGLIPLVMVAWADHQMEEKETEAVLKAAAESGLKVDSAAYQLVLSWLENEPAPEVLQTWKNYISSLKTNLDDAAISQLKHSVINRAKKVANSAGGILGMAKTSAVEQKMIDELESAF